MTKNQTVKQLCLMGLLAAGIMLAQAQPAFALNIYTAPPTCGSGQMLQLTGAGWSCTAGTPATIAPPVPTCPSGQMPVLTGGTTWICESSTSADAAAEQTQINFLAQVDLAFATYCPAGTTLVVDPIAAGGANILCIANSVLASNIAGLTESNAVFGQYNDLSPQVSSVVEALVAAQLLAAEQAPIINASYAADTPLGDVLCKVAGWFTGNTGKALATVSLTIVGILLSLGKLSWRLAILFGVGIGIIFGAPGIVGAMGHNYSLYNCSTFE